MAKSTVKRERFINRYRGKLVLATPATDPAVFSWNTGMNVGRADPYKWVITHFAVWPNYLMIMTPIAATDTHQTIKAQLQIGTNADLMSDDDMQVVATAQCQGWHLGDSALQQNGPPLQGYLPSPIPVFAQTLTVAVKALANSANLQGQHMAFEIGYVAAPIAQDEIIEYLAAFGQI